MAAYPCWATVPSLDDVGAGTPDGSVWLPGECDVPIRDHDWFWHPGRESRLYPLERLMEMYYHSVGRNCNLLLNANIDRSGRVPEADMERYQEFGREIRRRFGRALAVTSGRGACVELTLGRPRPVDHAIIMEQIREGERVREFILEGLGSTGWSEICRGTAIGHKRIERFPARAVSALRLRVSRSTAEPLIRRLAAYHAES